MIMYDPTEARANTRLPKEVIEAGHPLKNLEAATGCDLIVTGNSQVIKGDALRPPASIVLKNRIEEGSFLIQRKSGMDLLNSIPNLSNILWRMRQIEGGIPWLLICGEYFPSSNDKVVYGGGFASGWHWNAYKGAVDAWQILGGLVHEEPDDAKCGDWILRCDKMMPKLQADMQTGMQPRPTQKSLTEIDPHPEKRVIAAFPECGDILASRIMEYAGNSLKHALWWMSLPEEHVDANAVGGIGKVKRRLWRKWMNLGENEVLFPYLGGEIKEDESGFPKIHWENDG